MLVGMPSATSAALSALARALPDDAHVITDPDSTPAYAIDRTFSIDVVPPAAVVLARTTAEVEAVIDVARTHQVPVVPRGAGTGIAGGSCVTADRMAGAIVLSTERMTKILDVDVVDQVAVVEPGVVNGDLNRAAGERGLFYAPDPGSSEISTIGGNVATNAGGLRCAKYGSTKQSVLGLEVVTGEGKVLRTGGRTLKRSFGYDLTSLFVGSEGTLGVVTEATVRLLPAPTGGLVTGVAFFSSMVAACAACTAVNAAGLRPLCAETIDRPTLLAMDAENHTDYARMGTAMLLVQLDSDTATGLTVLERVFKEAGATEVMVTDDAQESATLVAMRRLAYPAIEAQGQTLVEDVCVPRSKVAEMTAYVQEVAHEFDVEIYTLGHCGDGNVHPIFVYERGLAQAPAPVWEACDRIFRKCLALGGTLTGEHGVGVLKQQWVTAELGEDVMAYQHRIKDVFDPVGILNPGKAI